MSVSPPPLLDVTPSDLRVLSMSYRMEVPEAHNPSRSFEGGARGRLAGR
jgi:hypothetical protein